SLEEILRLLPAVDLRSAERLRPLDVLHVYRDFDFENLDAVSILRELSHAARDHAGLLLREIRSLLVGAFLIADQLEEERNIVRAALVANPLNPRVLALVHLDRIVGRVIQKDLDAIGAGFLEAPHRPVIEEIGQT